METPDEVQEDIQVRDSRGENRTHVDNSLIKDFGWLIGGNTIAVYVSLLMHANRRQGCYPSIQSIADLTALSKPTVIQCIKLLEFLKIIKKTQLGKMCNNRYVMLDKINWRKDWKEVSKDIEGEVKLFNFSGKAILLQRLNHLTSNSNKTNSNKTQSNKSNAVTLREFSLKETLKQWSQDTYPRWMQILAYFIERKGLRADTKAELDEIKGRHVSAAKKLEKFADTKRVKEAMDQCEKDEKNGRYKWTLESVLKQLTK